MSGYFWENLFSPEFLSLKSCIMLPSFLVLEINWKREEKEGHGGGAILKVNGTSCVALMLPHGLRRKASLCGCSHLCLILR